MATIAEIRDLIRAELQPIRDDVQTLRDDIQTMREDMQTGFQSLRSLVGEVHETATRGDLRILYGHPFSEPVHVRNAFSLVQLVTPWGLLLPSEHGLKFADNQLGSADANFLQNDRAMRMVAKIYVSNTVVDDIF